MWHKMATVSITELHHPVFFRVQQHETSTVVEVLMKLVTLMRPKSSTSSWEQHPVLTRREAFSDGTASGGSSS